MPDLPGTSAKLVLALLERGNLLRSPTACCRPSALMTVCADCSATLRMVPRLAVGRCHWPLLMVLVCRFWLHNLITHHLSTTLVHTTFYTEYLLTPHLYTQICPTQLFHTQFFDTLFPTQYLHTQRFYIHSCPIPLFHPQHFHTRLFPTHHFYTPRLYTISFTNNTLHGTLSRTFRHTFLAHTDPPPSLCFFLPFEQVPFEKPWCSHSTATCTDWIAQHNTIATHYWRTHRFAATPGTVACESQLSSAMEPPFTRKNTMFRANPNNQIASTM